MVAFGIELRRMLEPSHYAFGGPKALPFKPKLGSEIHPSRSFVETVKASGQVRKHLQQPSIREKEKIQAVENTLPSLRDESWNQVVAVEVPADNDVPIAVGGVDGSDRGINGETKIKEKIPEHNKFRFPLNNLNLKDVDSGREHQVRRYSWLRKGLIVEVNEFGKRRVSWHRYRGDKQAVKWVAHGTKSAQEKSKGMDHGPSKAHAPQLGNGRSYSGPLLTSPFIFEAGECSKLSQNKPSPVFTCPNVVEGYLESRSSGPSSKLNGASSQVYTMSSVPDSLSPRMVMAPMVTGGSNSSLSAPENSRWEWV